MEQTFKPEANVNMLLHQFFDTMLSFAARVLGGEMPDDDATTQWAFEQIYSFVVPNVREELLISSGSFAGKDSMYCFQQALHVQQNRLPLDILHIVDDFFFRF